MESEYVTKIKAILQVRSRLKPGFEQEFMFGCTKNGKQWPGITNYKTLSSGQRRILDRMYGDYVLGLKNAIVPVGRVTAEKARGGWTVKVDDRICGDPVSEKDAQCVVQWLGRNIEWLLNGKNPPRRKEADKDEIEDLINTMYEEKKNGGTKTEEPRRPERNVSVADFM